VKISKDKRNIRRVVLERNVLQEMSGKKKRSVEIKVSEGNRRTLLPREKGQQGFCM